MLLLLYLGCTTNQRNIPFGYLHHLVVQHHQSPLQFAGVADGVCGEGSGDNTKVYIQIVLEAFPSMLLRTASFTDKAFICGKKTKLLVFGLLYISQIIRISRLLESSAARSFMRSLSLGCHIRNCNSNLLQGARIMIIIIN